MEVKIFYCNSWVNFLTKASSVEDELNKNFPSAKVSKEVGEKGGFKVEADGKLIMTIIVSLDRNFQTMER